MLLLIIVLVLLINVPIETLNVNASTVTQITNNGAPTARAKANTSNVLVFDVACRTLGIALFTM